MTAATRVSKSGLPAAISTIVCGAGSSSGMSTLSMTWITPLRAMMSASMIWAWFTRTTSPSTVMATSEPWSVVKWSAVTTSAARWVPGTAW